MSGSRLRIAVAALVMAGAGLVANSSRAQVKVWSSEEQPDETNVAIFGFLQPRSMWQSSDWKSSGSETRDSLDFSVRRARIGFEVNANAWIAGKVEADLGNGHGAGHLVDAYATLRAFPALQLRLGHFRPPISRQNLISSRKWQFADPAVFVGSRHSFDRQDGMMLLGRVWSGKFSYSLGVFDGKGRSSSDPGHRDRFPMVAGRVVLAPFGSLPGFESDVRPEAARRKPLVGFGVSYAHDCLDDQDRSKRYVSADFSAYWRGATLAAEVFFRHDDTLEHVDSAGTLDGFVGGLAGTCVRQGGRERASQQVRDVLGYELRAGTFLPGHYGRRHLELAVRHSYFDPQRNLNPLLALGKPDQNNPEDTAVGFWSLGIGLNWFMDGLRPNRPAGRAHDAKMQLSYERRAVLDKYSDGRNDVGHRVLLQWTMGF